MLLNTIFYTTAFAAAAVPALAAPAMREGAALDAASSVVHPQQWPEVAYPQVLTASGEAHVRALLARMSVEQKVGQIIQADIGSVKIGRAHVCTQVTNAQLVCRLLLDKENEK